jgi:hypothetical protein
MHSLITSFRRSLTALAVVALVLGGASSAFAGVRIIILNADAADEGFNDPTPATPVGGNPGTTKGEQRQIAFEYAASIWGSTLDSNQDVYIYASFDPLATNVLGSAGAWDLFYDFAPVFPHPGPQYAGTYYSSALADKRAGRDLDETAPDIIARFSSNFDFYLGIDNNHGAQNDLVAVLLHEFAHGLGFQTFVGKLTGAYYYDAADPVRYPGIPDVYALRLYDNTQHKAWVSMTDEERRVSVFNWGNLVWHGDAVNAALPSVLSYGSPEVRVTAPMSISGAYQFGTAAFGAPLSTPGVTAQVVQAVDESNASGTATTDACTTITNAADVAGRIAIVDRGTCGFVVKAKNAQDAGAIGVIVANNAANAANAPPGMGGVDPTVVVPAVSVSYADGNRIKAELGNGVTASLSVDMTIRAGADQDGNPRMYAPFPVATGSNVSHYDTVASRNLLMEPAINPDLTHNVKAPDDLTLELLRDIGWFPDGDVDGVANGADVCAASDLSPTISFGSTDSGAANHIFSNGCTTQDYYLSCVSPNLASFLSCTQYTTYVFQGAGVLDAAAVRQIKAALSAYVKQTYKK